ncbi:putative flippase GtrA [Halohasta litchfieldiae]|jgi:putative flippase GtrA|uniref:Putative flippase GtrA (Transmembrane translocase of bactoprenol-linked glucose) n=1 Tax=Halohasta litchfieldiae TaxID=1073996 RepID=A0A1H6WD83_9EURY|nr:GtrA family protein [Halohasta litchfieldiae]ATW87790.1 putative flippase GtrA [Halohasta litchfieldiae]SEJ14928.1 Putative flippase GtrA (transmembrane translocase of bactoprenol-linked glucose) [Halohasta litchfieldiae]
MFRSFLRNLTHGPLVTLLRRFVIVGALTAGVQQFLLWLFLDWGDLNYLLGALIAIELTIILSYILNNAWTFEQSQNTGTVAYLIGLLKTNLVRGSAIPIQLGILYVLVEWLLIPYLAEDGVAIVLVGNGVAIVISGIYRFVLDSKWTWG